MDIWKYQICSRVNPKIHGWIDGWIDAQIQQIQQIQSTGVNPRCPGARVTPNIRGVGADVHLKLHCSNIDVLN